MSWLAHPNKLSVYAEHLATFLENYYMPSRKNCLPEQYTVQSTVEDASLGSKNM